MNVTANDQAPLAFHLLTKPTGAICNLDCKYCFFLSKEMLYSGSRFRMADELLDAYIKQLIAAQPYAREISLAWQGGEPTLMGLDFFKRAVELAERYRKPHQQILHTLQTNGTRLNDEWAAFFKAAGFLVGLSLDGPREINDRYRVKKSGAGSFDEVIRGWEALRRHQVEVNILCSVHAANQDHPLRVYHFFRDELGAEFIQFIPIIERADAELISRANSGWSERAGGQRPFYQQQGNQVTERSVDSLQYGRFMADIFDDWVRHDVGRIYVQLFDATLGSWVGEQALCIFKPTCGTALALEHNGDLYSCDHYVEPDYLLGNITETPIIELVASQKQQQFGQDKLKSLPQYCLDCKVNFACHGECPRNRFIQTPDGEAGLNYLCAGYQHFFNHVTRPMNIMKNLLRANRAPAEIMRLYAAEDAHTSPCSVSG